MTEMDEFAFVRVDAFRHLAGVCDKMTDVLAIQRHADEIKMNPSERAAVDDLIRARMLEISI